MGNTADTGNDPAAPEPLPAEGAEISSDPAAQPAESDTVADADGRTEDQAVPAAPRIPLHPLAQILPLGGEERVREVARRLTQGDPVEPVILYEGKVLYPPILYLACLEAGREPTFEPYTGNDPLGFVIDRQLHQGYLDESQRGMLAARVCNFPVGGNQYSPGLSIGRASELLNVSSETISRAKKVLARGIPELVKAVDDGVLKVWKAYTIAKKQPQQQREELDRLLAADSPFGRMSGIESHNPPEPGSRDTSQEVQGDPAVADADGAMAPELPETAGGEDQSHAASTSTAAPGAPSSASAAVISPPILRFRRDEWIWPGYIPIPGVTAIVGGINAPTTLVTIKIAATVASGLRWPDYTRAACGEVLWLTAQRGTAPALHDRLAAAGARFDFKFVHIVEPEPDVFGLPIHDFSRDLQRLERKLSGTDKVSVAVMDYLSCYLGEDVEQTLRDFRGALRALKDFATKFGVAVILPCRLPCGGGSSVIPRVIDALGGCPEVDSALVVEGTNRGTVVPKKTWTGLDANEVAFRTSRKLGLSDSASTIVWKNSIATKSAARYKPYTTESLANREIANTSDPEVTGKKSSPGVVPAQSEEIPATPAAPSTTPPGMASAQSSSPGIVPAQSEEIQATPAAPSTTPGVAPADSIEGAAATRGTRPQSLRAGASANLGKPVLGLTRALGRKPPVAVPPLFPKRVPGTPAPFSSATAKETDGKGRRLATPVVLRQADSTKVSPKLAKFGKRKVRKKKAKRPSGDDPSDWW